MSCRRTSIKQVELGWIVIILFIGLMITVIGGC